nr:MULTISPECIES: tripartite tricarboxylate transporter substrate-binding protein [unclassified Variovorax]
MLCADFLQSIYAFVFNKLNYAAQRDILPASTVVEFPMALAVPASSPVKTFAEYAQWVQPISSMPTSATQHREVQPISWDCRSPRSSEHRCRTCRFRGGSPDDREPNRQQCRRGKFDGWRLRAAPQGRQASRAGSHLCAALAAIA